jgi:UDP-N-acetyl-D-glucosamine dehydrogenase
MTAWVPSLLEKIERREAHVGIAGLGYVGLPLALNALDAGFRVTGIDISRERLAELEQGHSYLVDVSDEALKAGLATKRLTFTPEYEVVSDLDVLVIAVPTPLAGQTPDLSSVLAATDAAARHLRAGCLVSLESTTYPGTTEEVIRPRLEARGLAAGHDFALAFSPERIDPGNPRFGLHEIPKIVGGLTENCGQIADAFYSTIVGKTVLVRRPREAEMAKILENTYRQVNIALANEFAMVAHELDVDIWEVIEAAATKPFGFQPFYPGVGTGGHCIAVDPVYLTWRIRELGRAPFRLVELAREVDDAMPTYVIRRMAEVLEGAGKLVRGSRVLVLGVTYKPDVNDIRESRALEVCRLLVEEGSHLSFHDPFVPDISIAQETYQRVDLEQGLKEADLVAVLTHHSAYDWHDVIARSSLVFDARGVTLGSSDPKVHRL